MAGKLFIIDGPSGAGKSHFLRHAESRFDGFRSMPKLTTRPRRACESADNWSDLTHVTIPEFEAARPDLRYRALGHWYGLVLAEVRSRLSESAACGIVVRDVASIRDLTARLDPERVVTVFVDADRAKRRQRLLGDGLDPEEVRARLAMDEDPASDPDPTLYSEILRNDGSLADYEVRIESVVGRHLSG